MNRGFKVSAGSSIPFGGFGRGGVAGAPVSLDNAILTEAGEYFLTESGDNLILE